MSLFTTGKGYEPEQLINNYPWNELGTATVVDVGGSQGEISIAIAQSFPLLSCIVQDRPEVIADKEATVPMELRNRVTFMAHDFFTQQPVKNADVYLLRWILHDWPDKYAIQILKALVPALKPGGKVLVNEFLVPEPGMVSPYVERGIRLAFLISQNATDRRMPRSEC